MHRTGDNGKGQAGNGPRESARTGHLQKLEDGTSASRGYATRDASSGCETARRSICVNEINTPSTLSWALAHRLEAPQSFYWETFPSGCPHANQLSPASARSSDSTQQAVSQYKLSTRPSSTFSLTQPAVPAVSTSIECYIVRCL